MMTSVNNSSQQTGNNLLIEAINEKNIDGVKQALIALSQTRLDKKALTLAATLGYLDIVQLLIPVSDLMANNSEALRFAAEFGHAAVVEVLIPVSDPKAADSQAFKKAAHNGHQKCIDLLISVSDTQVNNNEILVFAARRGQSSLLKQLIPVCDPTKTNYALAGVARNGHIECVKLLIPISNCDKSLQLLETYEQKNVDLLKQLIFEHKALLQKEILTDAIEPLNTHIQPIKRKI